MRIKVISGIIAITFGLLAFYRASPPQADVNIPAPKAPITVVKLKQSETTRKRNPKGCGPVPAALRSPPYNLDEFYQQYCDADGIPILASSEVDPEALRIAKHRINIMTRNLSGKVKWAMIDAQTRIAILGKNEVMTDIPEKSDLNEAFPYKNWNEGSRGLGPTKKRPVAVTGEENVLCLKGNQLPGSDTFVHEFAHTVHRMGLRTAEPDFDIELKKAYEDAVVKRGLWKGTYASTNYREYWAVAVQIWFDVNYTKRSKHKNYINTKAQLVYYDPALYNLVAKYFPATSILICPN